MYNLAYFGHRGLEMQLSLRAVNHANVRSIKEIMEILNCSKSLHANNVRSGFILLRTMFLSLFVFSTANLKGAQENESGFADCIRSWNI